MAAPMERARSGASFLSTASHGAAYSASACVGLSSRQLELSQRSGRAITQPLSALALLATS